MPLYAVGGLDSGPFPGSIWNGKDPRPEEAVENCDAVDRPSVRLLGGAGRSEISPVCVLGNSGRLGVGAAEPKDCWARGDVGGDRTGLSEIGEGGTKGKDSRIESARVESADITEELEILRLGKSTACASCALSNANCCCSSKLPELGVISLPIVVLNGERGTRPPVEGVKSPTFTMVALPMSATDPAWVLRLEGRSSPERVHGRVGLSATQPDAKDV